MTMWSVLLVFLSSLDRNLVKGGLVSSALDAKKLNKETFCFKVSSLEGNVLYEVSNGVEVVRSLMSAAGSLVDCSISEAPEQVAAFTLECKTGQGETTTEKPVPAPFHGTKLQCERYRQSAELSHKNPVHKRSRRGFTYPGTLWCGAGNMADNYNQLGDFADTDSCCRTHDHCPHVIHAFSSNFGYTNFKWHSISHCDCDEALKACLRIVNDTSSRVVGQAFFNVLEAPCFNLAYEEQCVERHWYGLCKRFEKRPIAMLTDAVPYDFGGIDVIDELTVAPSREKESNKSGEQVQPESSSQSPVTNSPEEPSLKNVMTAAEDFIKVLATVSTSQSSTEDKDAHSTEKKKKKTSQKKKKTKKTKGKGRKKKQKQDTVVKMEDNSAVPLSSPKEEGATNLSNFISESQMGDSLMSLTLSNKVRDNKYEPRPTEEASNEVMKDEPAVDEESISVTLHTPVKRKHPKKNLLSTVSSNTLHKPKIKLLQNKQRKVKTIPRFQETTSSTSQLQEQGTMSTSERPHTLNTRLNENNNVKKNRSKLWRERKERKKRLKMVDEHVEDNFEGNSLVTITRVQQPSQEADESRVQVTPLTPSVRVLKRERHRSKDKRIPKKKKRGQSPLTEHLSEPMTEEALLPIPRGTQTSSSIVTAISPFMDNTQTTSNWQLFTTTNIPTVNTKRLRNKKHGKSRNNPQHAAVSDRRPSMFTNQPSKPTAVQYALMTIANSRPLLPTTTSANSLSTLSHMQLSIERVREQFARKRKRKLALSVRQ